jgi:hypothetical protein
MKKVIATKAQAIVAHHQIFKQVFKNIGAMGKE